MPLVLDPTYRVLPAAIAQFGLLAGSSALVLLWVALGRAAWRRLGIAAKPATWELPVFAVTGLGVLGTWQLLVGVVGVLHRPVVIGSTVLAGVLVRRHLRDLVTEASIALRATGVSPVRLAFGGLTALLLVAAMAPPTDWDSQMYHLWVPAQYLDAGRVFLPPDNFHAALVGVAQMAALPLQAVGWHAGTAVVQVWMLVFCALATRELARRVGVDECGEWFAVAVLVGCPIILLVGITPRVDLTLTLALLASHVVLLSADRASDVRLVPMAGLLVGIALAVKPQAGGYALALVPLGIIAARSWRQAALAVAVAALVLAPWAIKNQILVGAPFYTLGAPGWFEPWIAELYGSRVPPLGFDQSVLTAVPKARASFDVLDAFFNPQRLTIEGEGVDYSLSRALLLLPLALLLNRGNRSVGGLLFVGMAYAALVIVPFGRINLRYLIPALPALAVCAAAVLSRAVQPLTGWRRPFGICGIVVLTLWPTWKALERRFWNPPVLIAAGLGAAPAIEGWRFHPDLSARMLTEAIVAVDRHVPADGRALLLFEPRGFAFSRPVYADVRATTWSYVSRSPAFTNCLAGTGVTHVLLNYGSIRYYESRGVDGRLFGLETLPDFAARCVRREVWRDAAFILWELGGG